MATYTFIGHIVSVGGSGTINVTTGQTFSLVLTDDDPTIGDPGDTGEMVSVDGATPESYTFLGLGTTASGETMGVIQLADGTLIGFNTNGTELANGNTKVNVADLDDTPVVPCFTRGTQILTPSGYVAIEDLSRGDLICTRDAGPQPVHKILFRKVEWFEMTAHLKPVFLTKGSLGDGLPFADMIVSPQHRFCISDWRAQLLFGEEMILASAKSLCNDHSIRSMDEMRAVTYIHLILEDHQIITANGVETETVLLSNGFLRDLPPALRREIETLFAPGFDEDQGEAPKAAARVLRHYEGQMIAHA